MSPARGAAAFAAGLVLSAMPFWRYAPLAPAGAAHVDHDSRYGGQLGMVGDHHVELVRGGGRLEAWVSDAWRRPVRPERAWVVFDGAARVPLAWERDRFAGTDRPAARTIEVVAALADGTRLAIGFTPASE